MFDEAETNEKRMILSKIIERIEVDRNYHLNIHFYVVLEDLQPVTAHGEVSIVQADHCIETKVG